YKTVLPLDYHEIRYEDLVENFENEVRQLVQFLEIPWHDSVLNYIAHAKNKQHINTPSYHQVTRPIYQTSKYRWERYAKQLAGIKDVLLPYVSAFEYTDPSQHNYGDSQNKVPKNIID
ncbi:MAG: sulfotransferase, partial [Desulfobacteraceae bacterium]|nr:sulfotransferase [Desulfobacteraceae bacterium]